MTLSLRSIQCDIPHPIQRVPKFDVLSFSVIFQRSFPWQLCTWRLDRSVHRQWSHFRGTWAVLLVQRYPYLQPFSSVVRYAHHLGRFHCIHIYFHSVSHSLRTITFLLYYIFYFLPLLLYYLQILLMLLCRPQLLPQWQRLILFVLSWLHRRGWRARGSYASSNHTNLRHPTSRSG